MNLEEKLLRKLIEIPSASGNEKKILLFLINYLSKLGFIVKKYRVDDERFNIVIRLVKKPKIYLQTHVDTVLPFIPFSEDKKYIYGRGACDSKASIACMISSAIAARKNNFKNFGLIFTVGEEMQLDGARSLINKKINLPFVIVGEPTSLKIVNTHYGVKVYKIISRGKSAHNSEPENGKNAIDALLETILKIKKIKHHPKTLINLAKINGGIADNVIPDKAEVVFTIRINPADRNNYSQIFNSFSSKDIKVKKMLDIDSVETKIPKELSFIKDRTKVKYLTELSFFKKGVLLAPGNIKYAHGPDEKIEKKELGKASRLYLKIIEKFN